MGMVLNKEYPPLRIEALSFGGFYYHYISFHVFL